MRYFEYLFMTGRGYGETGKRGLLNDKKNPPCFWKPLLCAPTPRFSHSAVRNELLWENVRLCDKSVVVSLKTAHLYKNSKNV